jgi:hypothetical protein
MMHYIAIYCELFQAELTGRAIGPPSLLACFAEFPAHWDVSLRPGIGSLRLNHRRWRAAILASSRGCCGPTQLGRNSRFFKGLLWSDPVRTASHSDTLDGSKHGNMQDLRCSADWVRGAPPARPTPRTRRSCSWAVVVPVATGKVDVLFSRRSTWRTSASVLRSMRQLSWILPALWMIVAPRLGRSEPSMAAKGRHLWHPLIVRCDRVHWPG